MPYAWIRYSEAGIRSKLKQIASRLDDSEIDHIVKTAIGEIKGQLLENLPRIVGTALETNPKHIIADHRPFSVEAQNPPTFEIEILCGSGPYWSRLWQGRQKKMAKIIEVGINELEVSRIPMLMDPNESGSWLQIIPGAFFPFGR